MEIEEKRSHLWHFLSDGPPGGFPPGDMVICGKLPPGLHITCFPENVTCEECLDIMRRVDTVMESIAYAERMP